ncbi:MAG: Mfa1 family fimbria major subunit [Tannerella sp.]|jgi:hypothetical protein|nr:Mfa1 family fimbria major subunit [Tannerella sp.]
MQIRWHKILSVGSIIYFSFLIFFSCTNEIGVELVEKESTGEDAYLSFALGTNTKELTTELRSGSYDGGTFAENKVSFVYLVLYDETGVVKYQIRLDVNNGDGSAKFTGNDVHISNDITSCRTKAQKIKNDNYKLLILANPQQDFINLTQVGKHKNEFENTQKLNLSQLMSSVGSGSETEYTDIFMSNGLNYIKINKDTHIFRTPEEAENTSRSLLVSIDRIVAKVTLEKNKNITIYPVGSGARFESIRWQLDNVNKQTFLMRKAAPMLNNESESSIPPGYSHYMYHHKLYATDPNWEDLSNERIRENGGTVFPDLSEHFYQVSKEHTNKEFADPALSLPDQKFQYVLENTMDADEQWEDVTTRVLIKANYIPPNFNANTDYYYFDNKAYSLNELNTMRNNNNWDSQGLKNTVEQAISEGFFTNVTSTYLGKPVNSKSAADGLLRYYRDGFSYYYILVRHFNDEQVPGRMGYGRYGIVRNNVYYISITSVSGPGSPSIPEPKGPNDKEYKYLSARINVLPWTTRSQSNIIVHPYQE